MCCMFCYRIVFQTDTRIYFCLFVPVRPSRTDARGFSFFFLCAYDIIHVFSIKGKWKLALELVERMKADGVTPTLTTYSSAADACAKGGNW